MNENPKVKVSLIGSGSWGCALAQLLAHNGHEVTIWSYDSMEAMMINEKHEHLEKLPGVMLDERIRATTMLDEACERRDVLVMSTPSVFVRATAKKMAPYVREGQLIVSVSKGIEEATLKTLTEQLEEEIPQAEIAALSGPSHAEEVARFIPTAVVVGAKKKETAEYLQKIFVNGARTAYRQPLFRCMDIAYVGTERYDIHSFNLFKENPAFQSGMKTAELGISAVDTLIGFKGYVTKP